MPGGSYGLVPKGSCCRSATRREETPAIAQGKILSGPHSGLRNSRANPASRKPTAKLELMQTKSECACPWQKNATAPKNIKIFSLKSISYNRLYDIDGGTNMAQRRMKNSPTGGKYWKHPEIKKPPRRRFFKGNPGRGERIRTSDSCVPNAVLYQAELHPDSLTATFGKSQKLLVTAKTDNSTSESLY